jgi:hypothetical protein
MVGQDQAVSIDALRRQLRRLRPPIASIAVRHKAWRRFEQALDPFGEPRALAEATPSRDCKMRNALADPPTKDRAKKRLMVWLPRESEGLARDDLFTRDT